MTTQEIDNYIREKITEKVLKTGFENDEMIIERFDCYVQFDCTVNQPAQPPYDSKEVVIIDYRIFIENEDTWKKEPATLNDLIKYL